MSCSPSRKISAWIHFFFCIYFVALLAWSTMSRMGMMALIVNVSSIGLFAITGWDKTIKKKITNKTLKYDQEFNRDT